MGSGSGFWQDVGLKELIRELRQVRDNPLYQYSKLTEQRRTATIPRQRRIARGAARLLGLAVLISAMLMALMVVSGGQSLQSVLSNFADEPTMVTWWFLLFPLYLSWLIQTVYAATRQALNLLSPLGEGQALHLTPELAATGITPAGILAVALARLLRPVCWCAAGGVATVQAGLWLFSLEPGYQSPDPDDIPIWFVSTLVDSAQMLPCALLAGLAIVLLGITAGAGVKSRGLALSIAVLWAWGQAELMFAGFIWDWEYFIGYSDMEDMLMICIPTAVALLVVGFVMLKSSPAVRSVLFGVGVPVALLLSAISLALDALFFYSFGDLQYEAFWVAGTFSLANPMLSGFSLDEGFYAAEPWGTSPKALRIMLLAGYQLLVVTFLLAATRRSIQLKLKSPE